jgi:general secretion pathway protein F
MFGKLYVSMVKAGESGGVLDSVLIKLNEFLEARQELRSYIVSAMIYPLLLVFASGLSVILLLTFVLPKFSAIFTESGNALPFTMAALLSLGKIFGACWWIIPGLMAGGFFAARSWIMTEKGRTVWDRIKLKGLRDIITRLETARFCRTLGTLLRSGVPILQSLANSKEVIENSIIAAGVDSVTIAAKQGKGISGPLSATGVFPPLALSMIQVGEESGNLEEMLGKVAVIYERSLRESIRRFIALFEPALILIMGLVVGFIIISLLTTIFGMMPETF